MLLLHIIWGGRRWILASFLLFFLGTAAGWWMSVAEPQLVLDQMRPVLERLSGIGSQVVQSQSPFERAWLIYRNNAQAVSVMMLFGAIPVIGATLPAFGMFGNGALLGVVLGLGGRLSPRAVEPMQLVLGLAPHGIFELPAIWLVAAWSMRLGLSWLMPGDFSERWERYKRTAREAVIILGVAMALLIIAAIIEGNLTLALVRRGQAAIAAILLCS
jgi:stage II sporulation protein M